MSYDEVMKMLTVRLPRPLVTEIEAEARKRRISKSDVVRERLRSRRPTTQESFDAIADLVGSVDGLPTDLAENRKAHLKKTGYGRTRTR